MVLCIFSHPRLHADVVLDIASRAIHFHHNQTRMKQELAAAECVTVLA
jgi:hypothetical protein